MASKRGYLDIAELQEFADITVSNDTEAYDQISQAEELIDAYVGFQRKAVDYVIEGHATAGSDTSLTLESRHQNNMQQDYLKGLQVAIVGGTGIGKIATITGQTYAGVITFSSIGAVLDSTSIYRIRQIGKFPRQKDEFYDSSAATPVYYRQIPEEVRRATAAQVQFMIEKGTEYFAGDGANLKSESIGDYSYTKGSGGTGSISDLISPRAMGYLRGIVNRKGYATDGVC